MPLGIEPSLAKVRVRNANPAILKTEFFGILKSHTVGLDEWPCPPDYFKDAAQVYSELARCIIEKFRRINLLGACEHVWLLVGIHDHLRKAYRMPEIPGLPSWAAARASVPLDGGCGSILLPLQTAEDKTARFAVSGNSTFNCQVVFSPQI